MDSPVDMLDSARNAENPLAAVAYFGPHRAPHTGAMHDPVRNPAQRHHGARMKRRSLRQTTEARSDPRAMTSREILGVGQGAARRHG